MPAHTGALVIGAPLKGTGLGDTAAVTTAERFGCDGEVRPMASVAVAAPPAATLAGAGVGVAGGAPQFRLMNNATTEGSNRRRFTGVVYTTLRVSTACRDHEDTKKRMCL